MLATYLFGIGGAALPELARLRTLSTQKLPYPKVYYLFSLLFILVSGVVVIALPGNLSHLSAMYSGAAAPLILSRGATHIEAFFSKKATSVATTAAPAPSVERVVIDDMVFVNSGTNKIRALSGKLRSARGLYRYISAL